jgi:hypothetical protein
MHIHIHTYTYKHIHIHTCTYTYIHTYTHTCIQGVLPDGKPLPEAPDPDETDVKKYWRWYYEDIMRDIRKIQENVHMEAGVCMCVCVCVMVLCIYNEEHTQDRV